MSLSETIEKIFFGNIMIIIKRDNRYDIISYERKLHGITTPYNASGNHFTIDKYGEIISGRHHRIVDIKNGSTNLRTMTFIQYANDTQFSEYLNTVKIDPDLLDNYIKTIQTLNDIGAVYTIHLDQDIKD